MTKFSLHSHRSIRFWMRSTVSLACIVSQTATAQEEDLHVFSNWKTHNIRWIEQVDASYAALNRINQIAFLHLDNREEEMAHLTLATDWKKRQAEVQTTLNELLAPMGSKTPLRPQIHNTLVRDSYTIELLSFESLPNFHVTAALYIPSNLTAKAPAVLYLPGHASNGFKASHYQKFCLNLVHKGFVVLTFDPIDQGERLQAIDPTTGTATISRQDFEHFKIHSYPGNQCYLSGVSIARYFVWDAIRAIDYLETRSEVDATRIAATGNSGGGNITTFLAALDDRVAVSVPSCWVTSYRRMLEMNGLQDAEQNLYQGLAKGIEHIDFLLARAPKPTLLLTTTRDFFPIQGARETDALARKIWDAFGSPENFDRVEDDHGHGYTKKNSEAAYAFLMKHLDVSRNASEKDYPILSDEALRVTPTGQVATSFNSETVQTLNRTATDSLLANLNAARNNVYHLQQTVEKAKVLSGYQTPSTHTDVVYRGGYQRHGYRVDKYGLVSSENSLIPLLLFKPDSPGPHPTIIVAHPEGKSWQAGKGELIESLVQRGHVVAAIDAINTGELKMPFGRQNDHNLLFYTALMSGTSVVGLQASDLVQAFYWLQTQDIVDPKRIGILASGHLGPAALHAAAFEPRICSLILFNTPTDYASMVLEPRYRFSSDGMVAGALTAYDLPDLLACMSPRKVALINPVNQDQEAINEKEAQSRIWYTRQTYSSFKVPNHLRVSESSIDQSNDLITWAIK